MMPPATDGVTLRGVTRVLDGKVVLDRVDATIPAGQITAFVGDAVSGKTTALKIIAGVEKCDSGRVLLGARDLTGVRPGARHVALVSGAGSVMPHKSVYENIAYPLQLADVDKAVIDDRVRGAAAHFGLTAALKKRPKKLSERERYAISIARALVRDPAVYLIAAPDGAERGALTALARAEMMRVRADFGRTVVYATDDVDEVPGLADWVVVFDAGRVAQQGTQADIVARPASVMVAGMFGAILRSATVRAVGEGDATVRLKNGTELTVAALPGRALTGELVTLAVWPAHMTREGDRRAPMPEHCHLFDEAGVSLDPL